MYYHDITKDDMLNGDGLRVVLWVSGCRHRCEGCHNPLTWDSKNGLLFDQAAKQEIFDQLEKDYISGITISGGDPFHPDNTLEVMSLIREVKKRYPEKTVWIYTGYAWETIMDYISSIYLDTHTADILKHIDVLVDGKFEKDKQDENLLWKGSSNQRVIDVQATRRQNNPRIPVIYCPNYETDAADQIRPQCDR